MFHPFFNPRDFTDNELQQKLTSLTAKLNHSAQMGHTEMYNQILVVMETIQMEQQRRMMEAMDESTKDKSSLEFGDVVDELGITKYDNDK